MGWPHLRHVSTPAVANARAHWVRALAHLLVPIADVLVAMSYSLSGDGGLGVAVLLGGVSARAVAIVSGETSTLCRWGCTRADHRTQPQFRMVGNPAPHSPVLDLP